MAAGRTPTIGKPGWHGQPLLRWASSPLPPPSPCHHKFPSMFFVSPPKLVISRFVSSTLRPAFFSIFWSILLFALPLFLLSLSCVSAGNVGVLFTDLFALLSITFVFPSLAKSAYSHVLESRMENTIKMKINEHWFMNEWESRNGVFDWRVCVAICMIVMVASEWFLLNIYLFESQLRHKRAGKPVKAINAGHKFSDRNPLQKRSRGRKQYSRNRC